MCGPCRGLLRDCENFADGSFVALIYVLVLCPGGGHAEAGVRGRQVRVGEAGAQQRGRALAELPGEATGEVSTVTMTVSLRR